MISYNNAQVIIQRLLLATAQRDASDLHISVGHYPSLRIDGDIIPIKEEKVLTADDTEKLALCLLSEEQKQRLTKEKTVDFSYELQNKARFRINVFYQRGNLSMALRLIPVKIRTIQELNLPPVLERFTKLIQGLILFVGPSGHGKSTSLASLLDIINHNRAEHIITIEDPIEYLFSQDKCIVDQRELYQDTYSFPEALRSALREDPDVVMVGEMRDLETIATAITVAETGHLVFSTVHTNNASQTVDRIIDVFPSHQQNQVRFQLANVLSGIVSQRLIPKIGGGMAVACEVLIINSAVRNLIREQKTHQLESVLQTSADDGMIPMDKSLAALVKSGAIEMNHALMYANDEKNLRSLLRW